MKAAVPGKRRMKLSPFIIRRVLRDERPHHRGNRGQTGLRSGLNFLRQQQQGPGPPFISSLTSCRTVSLPERSGLRSVCTCSWWRPSPCSSGRPPSGWTPERLKRSRRRRRVNDFTQQRHKHEAGRCSEPVGVRMSESGNSSKLEVSSMLLISMGMAAGLSLQRWDRRVRQVTF